MIKFILFDENPTQYIGTSTNARNGTEKLKNKLTSLIEVTGKHQKVANGKWKPAIIQVIRNDFSYVILSNNSDGLCPILLSRFRIEPIIPIARPSLINQMKPSSQYKSQDKKELLEKYASSIHFATYMIMKLMGTKVCPIYPQSNLCNFFVGISIIYY